MPRSSGRDSSLYSYDTFKRVVDAKSKVPDKDNVSLSMSVKSRNDSASCVEPTTRIAMSSFIGVDQSTNANLLSNEP